jgi:hypothetical protein
MSQKIDRKERKVGKNFHKEDKETEGKNKEIFDSWCEILPGLKTKRKDPLKFKDQKAETRKKVQETFSARFQFQIQKTNKEQNKDPGERFLLDYILSIS